jgi:hypothetical protein
MRSNVCITRRYLITGYAESFRPLTVHFSAAAPLILW